MAAHLAWRFLVTDVIGTGGNFPAVAYLEIRPVAGVANPAAGGAAYASSILFGSAAGAWNNSGAIANGSVPQWFAYIFGAPVDCQQVLVRANVVYHVDEAWKDFSVQWSDDTTNGLDGTWTTEFSITGETPWTAGETRLFEAPGLQEARASQERTLAVVEPDDMAEVESPQARTIAVYNFPTEEEQVSQSRVQVVEKSQTEPVEVSQTRTLAVVRGRIANPRLRAWTFSLDGHDFYVLRLGDAATLIYDVYSEQWVDWANVDKNYWRVNDGQNWVGAGGLAVPYGSDIVLGDDTFGLLWFIDPNQPYDQHPDYLNPRQERYFPRILMGQVVARAREAIPCYAVWLTTDMGEPAYTGAGVQLLISDDAGKSFDDMGYVTVTLGDASPELSWYSLGQITAPGRLFKIIDDGAIVRIDGMEMNDGR